MTKYCKEHSKKELYLYTDGYEIDEENSTFDCIRFKKRTLTLTDVYNNTVDPTCNIKIACSSAKHVRKINAINNFILVAKYLNKGWFPNFNNSRSEAIYYITITEGGKLSIDYCFGINMVAVAYFRSKEIAQQAIKLLGEETIKIALNPI